MGSFESDISTEELGPVGRFISKLLKYFLIFFILMFATTIILLILSDPSLFPTDHIVSFLLLFTIIFLVITFLYGNIKSIPECDLIGGAYLMFMGAIVLDTVLIQFLISEFSIGKLLFVFGINFIMLFWGVMISIILNKNYKQLIKENIG